jgi:hypothetical protein
MASIIIGTEYNTQMTHSGILVLIMVSVQPIAIKYGMFVNPFAMDTVKTIQIHMLWCAEITWIDSAKTNSDPPCTYISLVNKSSEWLFSLLTLCIMLLEMLLAPNKQ